MSHQLPFPDVLASRYASSGIKALWGPHRKTEGLRDLWTEIMHSQHDLGLSFPPGAIESYERVRDIIDLERIDELDLAMRHDVMAQLRAFNELAGHECAHEGLTSRDETDNTEQYQIRESMVYERDKSAAVLARMGALARQYATLDIAGRSHMAPGQTTTHGKRIANHARELLLALQGLEEFLARYPLRGIKGAMGTQQDMLDILSGDPAKVAALDERIREHLGFGALLDSVGQVYPRTLDLEVLDILVRIASACNNFALTVRLMAGLGLAHEGRKKGQKGSSAMPHKKNARTSERITGLRASLCGFRTMIECVAGNQWFEGDVSCSVPRRLAFPGAFFALDGLYEALLTVLDEMELFPKLIARELAFFQPFLSTTSFLMAAVAADMGRETAYDIIQRHAMDAAAQIEQGGENTLVERLAHEAEFPLDLVAIQNIVARANHGLAAEHIANVCADIDAYVARYPKMAEYNPEPLR